MRGGRGVGRERVCEGRDKCMVGWGREGCGGMSGEGRERVYGGVGEGGNECMVGWGREGTNVWWGGRGRERVYGGVGG